jgi:hypothetical protein
VGDDGRAKRFPVRDYFSFCQPDGGSPHRELAGRRARFAEFEVDRATRRIRRASYVMIRFGPDGRPDPLDTADRSGLVARAIELGADRETRLLAIERLRDHQSWTPSPFLEQLLRRLVFRRATSLSAPRAWAEPL